MKFKTRSLCFLFAMLIACSDLIPGTVLSVAATEDLGGSGAVENQREHESSTEKDATPPKEELAKEPEEEDQKQKELTKRDSIEEKWGKENGLEGAGIQNPLEAESPKTKEALEAECLGSQNASGAETLENQKIAESETGGIQKSSENKNPETERESESENPEDQETSEAVNMDKKEEPGTEETAEEETGITAEDQKSQVDETQDAKSEITDYETFSFSLDDFNFYDFSFDDAEYDMASLLGESKVAILGITGQNLRVGQENRYEYIKDEEDFVVPKTGYYTITCVGAKGHDGRLSDQFNGHTVQINERGLGSYGSKLTGTALLNQGATLTVHVGGAGTGSGEGAPGGWSDAEYGKTKKGGSYSGSRSGAGGGSTFVKVGSTKILSARGGDGGYSYTYRTNSLSDWADGGKGGGVDAVNNASGVTWTGHTSGIGDSENGYVIIRYDKAQNPPVLGISSGNTGWTNGTVTLRANVTDPGSGLAGTPYAWSKNTASASNWISQNTYSVSGNGVYFCTVKDQANMTGVASAYVGNIDRLPPTGSLTASDSGWKNGAVSIKVTAEDAPADGNNGKSGLASTPYCWVTDKEQGWTNNSVFTVDHNGTVQVKIRDNAGNITVKQINITNIDTLKPRGEVLPDCTDWINAPVTLKVSAEDAQADGKNGKSGLAKLPYRWGENAWTSSPSMTVTENQQGTLSIRDQAGNQENIEYKVANIDTLKPELELTLDQEGWTREPVSIIAMAQDQEGDDRNGCSGLLKNGFLFEKIEERGSETGTEMDAEVETDAEVEAEKDVEIESEMDAEVETEKDVDSEVEIKAEVEKEAETEVETKTEIVKMVGSPSKTQSYQKESGINAESVEWSDHNLLITTENGLYQCSVMDNAGNITQRRIRVDHIDDLAPELLSLTREETWYEGKVKLFPEVRDLQKDGSQGSGLDPKAFSIDEGEYVDESHLYAEGEGKHLLKIRDLAGNVTTAEITLRYDSKPEPANGGTAGDGQDTKGQDRKQETGAVGEPSFPSGEKVNHNPEKEVEEYSFDIRRQGGTRKETREMMVTYEIKEQERMEPVMETKKMENRMPMANSGKASSGDPSDSTKEDSVTKDFHQIIHKEARANQEAEPIEKELEEAEAMADMIRTEDLADTNGEHVDLQGEGFLEEIKKNKKTGGIFERIFGEGVTVRKMALYVLWVAVILGGLTWMLIHLLTEHVTVYRKTENGRYRKVGISPIIRRKDYKQVNLTGLVEDGKESDYKIRFSGLFLLLHRKQKILLRTFRGIELRNIKKEISMAGCNL